MLFCRIGACLMLMPGFSSPQIPAQVRLFVALAVTLSLTPLLLATCRFRRSATSRLIALRYIVVGTAGRRERSACWGGCFCSRWRRWRRPRRMSIGLGNPFGVIGEENEVLPPSRRSITLSATALIFITDLHWEVFRGIVASYDAIPVKDNFDIDFSLLQFGRLLTEPFRSPCASARRSSSTQSSSNWRSASSTG